MEEVVDVLGRLDRSEHGKVLEGELGGHHLGIQEEELGLGLFQDLWGQLIRHQRLRLVYVLQIISKRMGRVASIRIVLPAVEGDPLGQVLQLVRQSLLLDDAVVGDRTLAQRPLQTALCRHVELLESQLDHVLSGGLLVDGQIFEGLVAAERGRMGGRGDSYR